MKRLEGEELAEKLLEELGSGEVLVLALRLVLLVGQQMPDDPRVIQAAREAVAAMKTLGGLTGDFTPAS